MGQSMPRKIELLAPAKNMQCGIDAIKHGADAVYIGAPAFGARASATNSIKDISDLCQYAHKFGVKIYTTLNTIIFDSQLKQVEKLIWDLHKIAVDAIIIQDSAILEMDIPPIAIHASTQMDLRTIDKIRFYEKLGIDQIVLPREFSLNEIRNISENCSVSLETFIHGALCVCFSGKCYVSQSITGRSANQGQCAQICRLPFDMLDSQGKVIAENKHLLSIKDLNRADMLEDLLDAGITSLKIEGRLKDNSYVKNITAYYRQKLDEILSRRPEYQQSSYGKAEINFTPNPQKSFNRGFTTYQLPKRDGIECYDTPKSKGEYIGVVKSISPTFFTLKDSNTLNNGDGIIFINKKGEQKGIRINRVDGEKNFPTNMQEITPNIIIYRNYDHLFEKEITKHAPERRLALYLTITDCNDGFMLKIKDEMGHATELHFPFIHQESRKDNIDYIKTQLSKLGDTPFYCAQCDVIFSRNRFIPGSLLSGMRQKFTEIMEKTFLNQYQPTLRPLNRDIGNLHYPEKMLSYLGNVSNVLAKKFYQSHGVNQVDDAFEIVPRKNQPLMFTKHCLRYSLGWCPKYHEKKLPYKEPLLLRHEKTKLQLEFDCANCQMLVYHIK